MKKLKVLMMGGMLAAGICLFAACGTANDDGTNNGVNDTSNTQVTTQENIPGTDNTTGMVQQTIIRMPEIPKTMAMSEKISGIWEKMSWMV